MLADIDPNRSPPPIETRFVEWCPPAHGLKIAATIFPETFRAGRDARLLLRVYRSEQFDLQPDRLELIVSLTQLDNVDVPRYFLRRSPRPHPERSRCPSSPGMERSAPWRPRNKDIPTSQHRMRPFSRSSSGLSVTHPPSPRLISKWTLPPVKIRVLPADVQLPD